MNNVEFRPYRGESELAAIMKLIETDLSEPYSIYTYRYFLANWPFLCYLALQNGDLIGVIVGKLAPHRCSGKLRGYIAMLAVDKACRKGGIGTRLVKMVVEAMVFNGAEEIVLEAEESNLAALSMYAKLGFVRAKRLPHYYLNGSDAFRLKLWTC